MKINILCQRIKPTVSLNKHAYKSLVEKDLAYIRSCAQHKAFFGDKSLITSSVKTVKCKNKTFMILDIKEIFPVKS